LKAKDFVMRVALVAAFSLCQCSAPQVVVPVTPLEHAQHLRDDGRLAEAEVEFQALADHGDDRARMELAETKILRGHHAEVLPLLKERLAANVNDAEAAGLLARAYDGLGRIDEAIATYARRLTLKPDDVAAAVRMAELLLGRGDPEHASKVAYAGLKLHPDEPRLLIVVTRTMLARGRLPTALELAVHTTEIVPRSEQRLSAEAWLVRGQVHALAGDLAEAEAALRMSLEILPDNRDAQSELAGVWLEQGATEKALAMLQKLVNALPADASLWNQLAVAKHKAGNLEGAIAALETAIRLQPRRPVLYRNLAEVALDGGFPERAMQAAAQARALTQERIQDAVAMPELDALHVRAIVATAMAQRVCRRDRSSAGLEQELLGATQKAGLKTTPSELTAAANTVEDAVRAAVARCRAASAAPAAAAPTSPSPSPGKP
jgi:tetratricopeptide (TPR) repeat protein